MNEEMNRRREECIQLPTVLATLSKEVTSSVRNNGGEKRGGQITNDDDELEMAYKSHKDLNK